MRNNPRLHAGDWVVVRSKEEILRTLNERGELDGLPFMPEMFQHCGKRFEVYKRAHKTCDPPNGIGGRRMENAVHLRGLRCDGKAHGGCQAACLIFWKEAWLRKESERVDPRTTSDHNRRAPSNGTEPVLRGCTEADVLANTHALEVPADHEPVYRCQSTQIGAATTRVPSWDFRQYIEDVSSGNERPSQLLFALIFCFYNALAESGIGFGAPLRWAYDQFQKLRGGTPYPVRRGRAQAGQISRAKSLDLRAGETVRVKDYQEILNTLDEQWKNRGMYFDREMVPFCNKTFRVQQRVRQIINEKTGKMIHFKSDAIILENAFCRARYSECRRFCPRNIYSYWREIWLERVPEHNSHDARLNDGDRRSAKVNVEV